ncbi:MAG: Na/Pi cotransporter family protein [Pirellulales bacterium]
MKLKRSHKFFSPRRATFGLFFLALLIFDFAGSTVPQRGWSAPDQSQAETSPAAKADPDSAAESGIHDGKQRIVKKLIPDIKVLKDSPTTVIDLADVVPDDIGGGGAFKFEVIFNKKEKVVKAEIVDGTKLILTAGAVGKSEVIIEATGNSGVPVHSKFQVNVWEPDYLNLVYIVIGGLGIFLLGMKSMSDGLQAVAGNRLRKMIAAVTSNRFSATGVGATVTMILQSSSITTVMVVGFVNGGFMTLPQAIGVIFGANIGTTITGWILVLKIGKYGLPIAGAAAFGYLFLKNDRWRYIAMAVMGLGMVFLGLELMKDGFGIIKDLPAFEQWFERFSADSYVGVLKCAAVGSVLTFIVQSSSATLGITIGLAQIGVLPFETAAALVLGQNVGTTITAWLASFGTTPNAKRAAYAHIIFNILGVAWITAVFPWYIDGVKYFVIDGATGHVGLHVTAAIAATHTIFNVANTVLFLPFTAVLARILVRIVPERKVPEEPHLTNLDIRILESPVLAIEQSRVEVLRMADSCNKMMGWLGEVLDSDIPDAEIVQKTVTEENTIDTYQDEIVSFMTSLLASTLPENLIDEARRQLRMADEYESVSDYIGRILKYQVKLRNADLRYEPPERDSLLKLHKMAAQHLELITESYRRWNQELMDATDARGHSIAREVRALRREIIDRMADNGVPPRISVTYNRQINAYRRVRDHAVNIAEAIAGAK